MRLSRQCAVLLWIAAVLWSATGDAGRLPFRIYRSSQGLPRNSVTCMVAGQNDVMWFCTTEGLTRFDGHEFRVFGPKQGLPSRTVYGFFPSRTGGYWLITDRGVCRMQAESKIGDPCRPFAQTPLPSRPTAWIDGFLSESPTGEIWAANESRIFRVHPEHATLEDIAFPLEPFTHVLAIAAGDAGTLLVGTEQGVIERSPGGQLRTLTQGMDKMGTSTIVRVPSGDYWLSTAGGLCRLRFRGEARTPEFRGGWIAAPRAYHVMRARDGSLWVNLGNAVAQLALNAAGDAHVLRRIDLQNAVPGSFVEMTAEDSSGHLWVAAEAAGVLRFEDNGFTTYGAEEGLGQARIASIFADRAGRLCVRTGGDPGVGLLRDGRFLKLPFPDPKQLHDFGSGWNEFGLQAHDGEWWIPSGKGLLRFAATPTENLPNARLKNWYHPGTGLACREIFRVFEDSGGDIWISCEDSPDGVARWDRRTESFHTFGPADGWPDHEVPMVFRQSKPSNPKSGNLESGALWMGLASGVLRFRNGRFQSFPLGGPEPDALVRDLFIDSAGRVWVATRGKGLYRCDDPDAASPHFTNYTLRDGLSSSFLRALTEDRNGFIYVSSVRGVDRLDPRAPIDAGHIRHFTAADGLPDNEHNVAFADPRGHLWFGTLNGLAEYDPSRAPAPSAPNVYFTRLLVRGEEVPMAWDGAQKAELSLAPERNQIQIEFFGAGSDASSALRFQYRLIGGDQDWGVQDWSEPAANLQVNYPVLPPGQLRFEVRAINADGQFSANTATLDLDVAAPFWRRAWFLALLVLTVAGVATMAYRYRVDQLLAMERLRTRIATDLHDDIGANLSQIAILSEVAQRGAGQREAGESKGELRPDGAGRGSAEVISTIARETVEQMSDIVWAVNPRHDRFDSLLHRMRRFAGDTLGGVGIELQFESGKLPADLTTPIEARRPLYLVFKEAVNNAARHSGASQVTVDIALVRGVLRMAIADNGRGFDPQASHEGEGVGSIGRRIRELGGTVEWEANDDGTRLLIALPLRTARSRIN